jgi:thermitase
MMSLRRQALCGLLVAAAVLGGLSAPAAAVPEPAHVPDQLIVTFHASATAGSRAAVHRRAAATVIDRIPGIHADVVKVGDERAGLAAYAAEPSVRFAELDVLARALHDDCVLETGTNPDCLLPNDPQFPLQWGLQNDSATTQPPDTTVKHDADVEAPSAWKRTQGSAATRIAILDSGIDLDHEDLASKVLASRNVSGSPILDDLYGHGTAVAGVAAPVTGNGIGVAGVGYDASLMNVKVLDDNGVGSCSTVAKGITWAADNDADVINMSLGFTHCRAGERAVNYAWDKGVLLSAAAGNDGNRTRTYPAYYSRVIAVAATDNADAKTSFSQYGNWVDVAAPGINVHTTFPNHPNKLNKTNYNYGKGTSMSAPFVAGAAGLIWSSVPDANGDGRTNDDVRSRIENYADDIPGTGTYWSAGRLNACNAAAASLSACPLP